MYSKCHRYQDAQAVFDTILEKDTVSWNAFLSVFVHQGDGLSAIQLFLQMQMECVLGDKYTYATMFSACSDKKSQSTGKHLHTCVLQSGLIMNNVMVLSLINMYGRGGDVPSAIGVFDDSTKQDMVIWNAVISTVVNQGIRGEAMLLFNRMFDQALMPDQVTFLNILSECANQTEIWQGKQLHACLLFLQLKSDVQVETTLIHMYGKHGNIANASFVFSIMIEYDTASWNAMISMFSQHGLINDAFVCFKRMQEEGLLPVERTFTSILSGCVDLTTLTIGKNLHVIIDSSGKKKDIFIRNALINMYCKCGILDVAHNIFNTMLLHDIISWNSLIAGYAQSNKSSTAFCLLNQMCDQEIIPDQATYCSLFYIFANEKFSRVSYVDNRLETQGLIYNETRNLEERSCLINQDKTEDTRYSRLSMHGVVDGLLLHIHIVLNGLDSDVGIQKSLLQFYGKYGDLRDCEWTFENVLEKDATAWCFMIEAFLLRGHDEEVIELSDKKQAVFDCVSFINVVEACANIGSLFYGRQIFMKIVKHGFDLNLNVGTALVTLYARCNSLTEARWLFDHLPERDVVAWTSMISTYMLAGNSVEALVLFREMQCDGVTPDVVSFTSALTACEFLSALSEGERIYAFITENQLDSDVDLITALIYMYGKSGSLIDAKFIFCRASEPKLSLWNALIACYAQYGYGWQALSFLFSMQQKGVSPNNMTFVSALCACSRAGLVKEAYLCLVSGFEKNGLVPAVEHFDCMVDLLGRTGGYSEAECLLKLMPFVPTIISWASFVGTCHKVHENLAESATKLLVELDRSNSAAYIALSNIYATDDGPIDTEDLDEHYENLWANS
ncbi:hypothetical protein KP509_36G054500 [Ceratopteris richardii]|nr:hypothetical protein KP509_36G054500 [Ceratopteris richardii]